MTTGGSGREGGRALKTRVKMTRKRTPASARWLERQLNDPYVAQARREGYRSRAAYKLIEIDDKHKLLKPGRAHCRSRRRAGRLEPGRGGARRSAPRAGGGSSPLISWRWTRSKGWSSGKWTSTTPKRRRSASRMARRPADGVLSDMAANATGHRKTDQLRIIGLVELAADFASEVLAPGGFFLAKVLQGGVEGELLARLKREFATVRHVKPKASRADSAELYLLATGFRGIPPPSAGN